MCVWGAGGWLSSKHSSSQETLSLEKHRDEPFLSSKGSWHAPVLSRPALQSIGCVEWNKIISKKQIRQLLKVGPQHSIGELGSQTEPPNH